MTTTSDIVKRLRVEWQDIGDLPCIDDMNAARAEAADRLEELEAKNKRLQEALEPFAKLADDLELDYPNEDDDIIVGGIDPHYITFKEVRAARAKGAS